jgi:membrane-associated phospholipid phosphatase
MILVAALTCKRLNWRRGLDRLLALRLIGGAYLGGLIVVVLKLIIPRVRPHSALFDNANTALDTFGRGLLAAGDHSRPALMSFPSGHAAVAAGLAVSLCWFYPSGRPAFIALAILASLQRINSSSHYLSDVCVGAALGLIGAFFCMPRGELPNHSQDSSGPTPRPD